MIRLERVRITVLVESMLIDRIFSTGEFISTGISLPIA